ncbi:SAVED domain-containing protein [Halomonas cupida]|uniref:SAVED domain-containing protein n=1 Tax=Halomonas cupida TaxID=44933 RepID=UPI0039B4E908
MPQASDSFLNNTVSPGNFDDQSLALWLDDCLEQQHRVLYVHAGYLCKVVDLEESCTALYPADPGPNSKGSLKKLVGKKLLFSFEVSSETLSNARIANSEWAYAPVERKSCVDTLIATRDGLLGKAKGRGPEISARTAQKVWADAAGRCMFQGCSKDLSEIPLWTKAARVGYLAHIVASDPEGPRGNQKDSHRLANNPDNIMLMCDEHHRLIDSFAPEQFTSEILDEMRKSHRDMARNYLNSLAFPPTKAITLHANLGGVPTYFHDSELIEAIVAMRRAMLPGVIHYVRRKSQRDDRHLPEFWHQYLREHEHQIRQLVSGFDSSSGSVTENLAVFPLHHIPTLVLAGRIMGEAQAIQIFQYDRHRKTWTWNPQVEAHSRDTFIVDSLSPNHAKEVLITLELTAHVDEKALPADLKTSVDNGHLPWIRVTTSNIGINCIGHPDDLDQFAEAARKAIMHAQDVMRVQKVHLIAVSPASTVFRFGQMLQAGHHPEYIVYDRAGHDYDFTPALSITGHHVSATDGQKTHTIDLR